MLLKSFFFNFYTLAGNFSFYLVIFILLLSFFFLFVDLRKKFFLFILVVIFYSVWGFLLDLDGIMLVFLTAELTIFLLFLMTYLQLYSNYIFITQTISNKLLISILGLCLLSYNPLAVSYLYTSFYKSLAHIVSSDFYILYYFLFEKFPILVIILTLIISFFSLFFIIMYFSLKLVKVTETKQIKGLHFLRKQVLVKQTNFITKVYTFQN